MIPRLTRAQHIGGYRLYLEFADGRKGEVDLEDQLWGEIFEPVREPEEFKRFSVHPELHTLAWSNGADFAPEYLYNAVAA